MEGKMITKSETRNTFFMVGLTLMLLIFVSTVAAQEKSADNMQIFLEKIKADKKLLVAENMRFTEAEAKAFWPVYEQYQSELFLLRTRTAKLIDDYAKSYDKMTNSTAKKLLDELLTIQALRPKLANQYLPKFSKGLSEAKVVRYYQIENKIDAVLNFGLAANIPLLTTEK
jgi:hypothetical protein